VALGNSILLLVAICVSGDGGADAVPRARASDVRMIMGVGIVKIKVA
jgi:hypothetical protein